MIELTAFKATLQLARLDATLRSALGAAFVGLSYNAATGLLVAHLTDAATPIQVAQVENLIREHNAALTDAQAVVNAGAEAQVVAIPNWAGWTEAQVLAWIGTNLDNLIAPLPASTSKTIMLNFATAVRAEARMLVAIRNRLWPNLQNQNGGKTDG